MSAANARSAKSLIGYWVPRVQVPNFFVWLYSLIDHETKQIISRLGRRVRFDNTKVRDSSTFTVLPRLTDCVKAKKLLGMDFINPEKSLIEMAHSLIERGILPRKSGYMRK